MLDDRPLLLEILKVTFSPDVAEQSALTGSLAGRYRDLTFRATKKGGNAPADSCRSR
jgi:hypothetical protein